MRKLIDLTGKKFGKLKVIRRTPFNDNNQPQWLCECECGNKIIVRGDQLRYGNVKSCGCEKTKSLDFKCLNLYNSYLLWCLVNNKKDMHLWKKEYKNFCNWIEYIGVNNVNS